METVYDMESTEKNPLEVPAEQEVLETETDTEQEVPSDSYETILKLLEEQIQGNKIPETEITAEAVVPSGEEVNNQSEDILSCLVVIIAITGILCGVLVGHIMWGNL